MKKKLYSTPVADYVEVRLPAIMVDLSQEVDEDEGKGDSGFGGANDYVGGAWENIWNQQ